MWQIELRAAQTADGPHRKYRIRLTTRAGPIVWAVLLVAVFGAAAVGGAGLILGVEPSLDTSAMAAAFAFAALFGATLGAATVSSLRRIDLRREEQRLTAEIDNLLARGRDLTAGKPPLRASSASDRLEDRVTSLIAALERGEIEPRDFDAALDEELQTRKDSLAG
jgi:hypothetical protein